MGGTDLRFAVEDTLDADEFIDVLERSGLAERRPVHNRALMERMCAGGNLVITARQGGEGGLLVGIARSVTDYAACVYLADLATDRAFQGRGIARRLIDMTAEAAGPDATLILLSAPAAMGYYQHIGLEHSQVAWVRPRLSDSDPG